MSDTRLAPLPGGGSDNIKSDMFGFIAGMVVVIVAACLVGIGFVIGRWTASESTAPRAPVSAPLLEEGPWCTVSTRTVSTQSQTTYTWWKQHLGFMPLGEKSHGAWTR